MFLNYAQYRYQLYRQRQAAKALAAKAPPDCEQSVQSGEMEQYHKRLELSEQWRALILTGYYRRKSESLAIEMPAINQTDMYSRVDFDDHPDEPYILTPRGLKLVRDAIREEQKHRREAVGYWFGIAVGLIGAITGLVSVLNG